MPNFTWMPESERTLRKLWARGLSASQIAEQFGGRVTRNAVIGKARRLHLPARRVRYRPWTENEYATLYAMRASGATCTKIARELKRTIGGVSRMAWEHGLARGAPIIKAA